MHTMECFLKKTIEIKISLFFSFYRLGIWGMLSWDIHPKGLWYGCSQMLAGRLSQKNLWKGWLWKKILKCWPLGVIIGWRPSSWLKCVLLSSPALRYQHNHIYTVSKYSRSEFSKRPRWKLHSLFWSELEVTERTSTKFYPIVRESLKLVQFQRERNLDPKFWWEEVQTISLKITT